MALTKIKPSGIDTVALDNLTAGPAVANIQVANSTYDLLDDTAVSTSGGYVLINGSKFASGASVLVGNTPATSVTFVSSSQLRAEIPAKSSGTYVVYVSNPDGSVAIIVNGLTFSTTPVWATDSTLSQGSIDTAISINLSASSDSNVVYSVAAGSSLPSGVTLSSNGLLSGTITGITEETTYNFTVLATDEELQDESRAFSITITAGDANYKDTVLHLNADTDTWITDASTNKFNLTVNGDTRPSALNPFNNSTSGSGYFDGSGDYLTVADDTSLDGFDDFTIECWVYWPSTTAGTFQVIFDKGWNGGSYGAYLLTLQSGALRFYMSFNGSSWGVDSGNLLSPVVGQWYHIAITRSGSSGRIFVNGTQLYTFTNSTTIVDSSLGLGIGGTFGGQYPLNGYISNVRIVKGTAVYTEAFTPPTSPLTAITNTSLLTLQSRIGENNNRFVDESELNNIITRAGNVTQGSFSPFALSGWSNYFDGNGDFLTTSYDSSLPAGTGDFCIEAWVYMTASLALNDSIASVSGDWQVSWQTSGFCFMPDGSSRLVNTNALEAMELHRWYHVAFTRESGTMRSYLNGVFTGSISNTTNHNDTVNGLVIGNNRGGTGYFTGYIADVRYVVGSAVYTTESSFTLPATPLTAITNTKLLTCQSNRFIDNSTNNLTITKSGDASVQPFSPLKRTGQWSPTTVGGSMYFDGSGDYLNVSNVDTAFGTSSDFTIDFWMYPTVIDSTIKAIFDPRTADASAHPLVWISAANRLYYFTTNAARITGTTTLTANQWYHVALVRSSGTTTLYLNGSVEGTWSDTTDYITSTTFRIGQRYASTAYNYAGYIHNLRVVKGTAIYTSAFTPPTAPTSAVSGTTMLLNGTSGGIIDYTGKNNLETVGNVRVSTSVVKYGTGAMYFDGVGDYITVPGSPSFDFGTGNFTLECWIYPLVLSGTQCILDAWNNAPTRFLLRTNGTALQFYTSYNNMSYTLPGANAWYHVAAVRNGSTTSLYVNGVSVGTPISSSATITASTALWTISRGAETWNGYIDDIRITKGVARYTANFTPPDAAFSIK